MSEQNQTIKADLSEPKFYSRIPHLADDELDLYEYRLYGHYRRVANENGACTEKNSTTAEKCGMSVSKLKTTRKSLAAKGYIKLDDKRKKLGTNEPDTVLVEIAPIWERNNVRYQITYPQSPDNGRGLRDNPKEESSKEKQSKKKDESAAAIASGAAPTKTIDDPLSEEKGKAEKERQDRLFEIIALGSFGKPYAELNGNNGRAGKIRKALLKAKPDITSEYLKAGYQLYAKENPEIQRKPGLRLKSPDAIIDKCEQAADMNRPSKPKSVIPDHCRSNFPAGYIPPKYQRMKEEEEKQKAREQSE